MGEWIKMKPTFYLMRGLPASGKSTKRREMLADPNLGPITYVNKDEIRARRGIAPGNFKHEAAVLAEEATSIETVLNAGTESLIVDNTHNSPKYLKQYKAMANTFGYEFVMIDMSDVSVEECIRRDSLREGREHVGEAIIRRMYNDFYNPNPPPKEPHKNGRRGEQQKEEKPIVRIVQDSSKPRAAIVDLDGTLAEKTNRGWYEYWRADTDDLVIPVHATIWALLETGVVDHLIFLTGREESGREAAEKFLDEKAKFGVDGVQNTLLMKATGDHRPDTIAKREMFDENVRDKYFVLMVFEDRTRVVKMWRDMGLTVFQVAQTD